MSSILKKYLSTVAMLALLQSGLLAQDAHEMDKVFLIKSFRVNDTSEYRLIVKDEGFKVWLAAQAEPIGLHEPVYYKQGNIAFVKEWNYRYKIFSEKEIYEFPIVYDEFINYGADLQYKLYQFFTYFEMKNQLRLSPEFR